MFNIKKLRFTIKAQKIEDHKLLGLSANITENPDNYCIRKNIVLGINPLTCLIFLSKIRIY